MPKPKVSRLLVHHLYVNRSDLLPVCGVWPGPDRNEQIAEWHTGHVASVLLTHASDGRACCAPCLRLAQEIMGQRVED